MTRIPPPTDPAEVLGEAYELALEKALDKLHVSDPHHRDEAGEVAALVESTDRSKDQFHQLSKPDQKKVEQAVQRDLHSMARYHRSGGTGAEGWLGFELHRLEGRLLDLIGRAADPTTTRWLEWKEEWNKLPYHTGEVTGPGVLVCDQCGEKLHFEKPGRIPPCPKCGGTVFHRLSDADA